MVRALPKHIPDVPDNLPEAARALTVAARDLARELLALTENLLAGRLPDPVSESLHIWGLGRSWPAGSEALREELKSMGRAAVKMWRADRDLLRWPAGEISEDRAEAARARYLAASRLQQGAEAVLTSLRRALAAKSKTGRQDVADAQVKHAEDYSWIRLVDGTLYEFRTVRQREIIMVLFTEWEEGGDGALKTEAAILEALNESGRRLRVAERFKGHPALGTILRRCEGREAAWALNLRVTQEPPETDH